MKNYLCLECGYTYPEREWNELTYSYQLPKDYLYGQFTCPGCREEISADQIQEV